MKMTIDQFNPDCMDDSELHVFFANHTASAKAACAFFNDTKPHGYVEAYSLCIQYCVAAYGASKARMRGDGQVALMLEEIADRIYARLPMYARW
jgi:hypothetical protein